MKSVSSNEYYHGHQIAENFANTAVKKTLMPVPQFAVFAFLGGIFIALGGLLSIMVAGGMPGVAVNNPGIVKFVAGSMFPLGLVLVVIAGAGIFTSDCATLPFAYWQQKITLKDVAKVAGIGYIANFLGALLVAWLLAYQTGTLTKDPWKEYAINLATNKTNSTFWVVFTKGIGANLMVCIAVWMASTTKDITGKIILIWMPVMGFVALGWEHSIANMFFIPLGIMLNAPISPFGFLYSNLLPATLGNIVGGMFFVALPYFLIWGKNAGALKSTRKEKGLPDVITADKSPFEKDILKQLN
jgi:formate/nitrite transporter